MSYVGRFFTEILGMIIKRGTESMYEYETEKYEYEQLIVMFSYGLIYDLYEEFLVNNHETKVDAIVKC